MTKVLIADASKPSLVMSSEVFKDKIPGCLVVIANSGSEMMAKVKEEKPDLCLVDFDLPDCDGASAIVALREHYQGPILMTAFANQTVNQAVDDLLFAFSDASAWVPKPVRFEDLSVRIEKFLIEKRRTGKRFDADLESVIVAKAEGRGKRAPKVEGKVVNISMGGVCVDISGSKVKLKKAQELTVSLMFPVAVANKKTPEKKVTKKVAGKKKTAVRARATIRKPKTVEAKFKATIAWITKDQVGIKFEKLNEPKRKEIEKYIRQQM